MSHTDLPNGAGSDLDSIHSTAVELARQAGAALQEYFTGPLEIRFKAQKKDADPVTQADEAVERMVRNAVAAQYPGHGFLGEEGIDSAADATFLWVVDPLDGTANFANGLPLFAVSIAVLKHGRPVVAALYTTFGPAGVPCVVHAQSGGGLLVNGQRWRSKQPVLSGRARLSGVPAGFLRGFWFGLPLRLPPGETRSLGSIAVELALVATGQLQYAVFGSPKIWDVAGGVLLVTEGGGRVATDRRGTWMPLDRFVAWSGQSLREWKQAVIAGEPEAIRKIVPGLRVRHAPVEIIARYTGPALPARARGARRTLRRLNASVRRILHR